MTAWPTKPFIYEINTWVWLDSLSRDYNWPVTLENVPDKILDELAGYGLDAIWLMGVWTRSAAAKASALKYASQYKPALPDLTYDDIIGSAYAIGSYQVDENLGGRRGLAIFRQRLHERGLKLVLDYVPNHVASDHAWIRTHPDYLVLGTPKDIEKHPGNFFSARDATGRTIVVAHGRDPYFPGWIDTAQINVFHPGARQAMLATLLDIADQCDGVRCDMAMLLVNDVFARTWQGYVSAPPQKEFWEDVIPQVKAAHPDFAMIAEVYWDMEARLLSMGFDFTYDKRLYDRIMEGKVAAIRDHLKAALPFQKHQVRFIENHDEQRAAETLGPARSRPAAALICTLPGAVLLHDGQLTGRRVKLPVQLGRQPYEPINTDLKAFYLHVLHETRCEIYQNGDWLLLPVTRAKENNSHENLIAYGWRYRDEHRLIVINLTDKQSQAHVNLGAWPEIAERDWHLNDVLNSGRYLRKGELIENVGLYVDLWPCGVHIFQFEPV
ncbi:MAG: alpha-amylase [Chloroflexi bacterium]|nr:alpha-amylase [Chloroflexota bacterium]